MMQGHLRCGVIRLVRCEEFVHIVVKGETNRGKQCLLSKRVGRLDLK